MNLHQIKKYIIFFQEKSKKLSEKKYDYFIKKLTTLESKSKNFNEPIDEDQFFSYLAGIQTTLSEVQNECRKVWTEYNLFLMFVGKAIMLISLVSVLVIFEYFWNLTKFAGVIEYKALKFTNFRFSTFIISFLAYSLHFVYELEVIEIIALIDFGISIFFLKYIVCLLIKVYKFSPRRKKNILFDNVLFHDKLGGTIFLIIQIGHGYILNAVGLIRTEGILFLFSNLM